MSRPERGFTVIELVGAVALIAVLTGLLLPAMQKVREATNRIAAERTVQALCHAGVDAHRREGRYPDVLADLLADGHPAADGADAGYRFTLRVGPVWGAVGDPRPGITGSDSVVALAPACSPITHTTPGEFAGRLRVTRDVLVAGTRAMADLIGLVPAAERPTAFATLRTEVADPASQARALDLLGHGGEVSLASAHAALACDGSVHPVSCRFWKDVQDALHLGAYDEDWLGLPAVQGTDRIGTGFIGAATLAHATSDMVHDLGLQVRLLLALDAAHRAERRGDTEAQAAAIGRFLTGVASGTPDLSGSARGAAVSHGDAWSLEVLARSWIAR